MTYPEAAAWTSAAGTLLAVFVALFKEEIVGWWRRPILGARVGLEPRDCHKTTVLYGATPLPSQAECYYLRLWIRNDGKVRASKVQVFVEEVRKKQADSSFAAVKSFLPMSLRWSHGLNPSRPEIYADGIPPGMGKHCDLGCVVDPRHRKWVDHHLPTVPDGQCVFHLDVEFESNTLSHLLEPGTYRLDILLAAANTNHPTKKTIELTVNGGWSSDEARMFREHLGLREIA
ncbi:MAG TPA: hypothetical protein VFI25_11335 [Planctomycetota bacterium]|nr:hypothetical protein [Planctomycetota bacterium]